MRLTDCYDNAGAPSGGGDNNRDISVRFVEQYNTAGECDEVIDDVATDVIVPTPNNELQVGTTQCSLPILLYPQWSPQMILFLLIISYQVAMVAQPNYPHSMSDL